MKNKINISAIRFEENNYSAISEISDKMSDFIWNNHCNTKEEQEEFEEIYNRIEKMKENLYLKAAKIVNEYLKQNKNMAAGTKSVYQYCDRSS